MADEPSAPAVEIPPDLAARAKAVGWPDELVAQALEGGASPEDLTRYMSMGVTADQVREFMAARAEGKEPEGPQLDLSWMNIPTEWGTRAKPTKRGLTLDAINIGKYGDVPDVWEHQTELPRGAIPIPGVRRTSHRIDPPKAHSDRLDRPGGEG